MVKQYLIFPLCKLCVGSVPGTESFLNVRVAFGRSWHGPPEPRNSVAPSTAYCQARRGAALLPLTLDSPPGHLIPLLISLSTEWIVLLCLISCSSRYSSLQTNTLAFDVLYTRHCLMLVLLRLLLLLPTTFLSVVRGQSTFSCYFYCKVRCTVHVSCLLISRMITCIHSMIHRASPSPIS